MNNILLFTGDIETLGYFSEQMIPAFMEDGYHVHLYDFLSEEEGIPAVEQFLQRDNCILITFNFIGLVGDGSELFKRGHSTFWDLYHVTCINIIVDHPFYYHEHLKLIPKRYLQFCIDREHVRYMKRFFPNIPLGGYLPLAGNLPEHPNPAFLKRKNEIVFAGNYTPPSHFQHFVERNGEEYAGFYQRIIDDMLTHPQHSMDVAMEKYICSEVEDVTEATIKDCMASMIFIDLIIRFHFRGLIVKTLADSGIPVQLYGAGWEHLACRHPENLMIHGNIKTAGCLKHMQEAQISLNVMPWFKEGLHDRIMSSMLCGALSLSDTSLAIEENFVNEQDIILYPLSQPDEICEKADYYLTHTKQASEIAKAGFEKSFANHTWRNRAKIIEKTIESFDFH